MLRLQPAAGRCARAVLSRAKRRLQQRERSRPKVRASH